MNALSGSDSLMSRLVSILLALAPLVASAAPPEDQWFTVLLDGRKIGSFETTRTLHAGRVVTSQALDLSLDRDANRALVEENLQKVRQALAEDPLTAYEVAPRVFGDLFGEATGAWLFTETIAFLTHMEQRGEVRRVPGDPERWAVA